MSNDVLRSYREQVRRESRDEFARAVLRAGRELGENVGCDASVVRRWESGQHGRPRPVYQRILLHLTGRTPAELGFAPPGPTQKTTTYGLDDATVEPIGAPASLVAAGLQEVVNGSRQLDHVIGPRQVVESLMVHIHHLEHLAGAAQTRSLGVLLPVLAEMYQLVAWMRFDLGDSPGADAAHRSALQAAVEVGDPALLSFTLGPSNGFSLAYTGRGLEATELMESSLRWARASGNYRLIAFSLAVGARAFAKLGDSKKSLRMLDEAESALGRHQSSLDDPPWLDVFDSSALVGHRASCLLDLGHPREAVHLFGVLDSMGTAPFLRNSVLWSLDLAHAQQQLGEPEASASTVLRALNDATSISSARIRRRLQAFPPLLKSASNSGVVSEMKELLTLAIKTGGAGRHITRKSATS